MDSKEGDDAYKNRIRAEAKASKAYFNMLLVNYYGKPYNPATAASDPGIPLVKQYLFLIPYIYSSTKLI